MVKKYCLAFAMTIPKIAIQIVIKAFIKYRIEFLHSKHIRVILDILFPKPIFHSNMVQV